MASCFFPLVTVEGEDPEVLLELQKDSGGVFNCALPCTGTMVDENEVDSYYTLQVAVSGVSLLLAVFCNLTWGLFSVKSKQKMSFWVTFASVCVTSFTFFPLVISGSGEESWCLDDHTPRRQSDGLSGCVLQGMAIIFFGLSLCSWWWCSCFDLFCKLFLRKRNIDGYLVYYHIFSWGLPTVCTLAILFTGNFGYEQPRLWCFLAPEAPAAFEYVFFYGWVGALWITGTIMFGFTIVAIFTGGKNGKGRSTVFKKLSIYRVPLVFVLIFSMFWAIFFGFSVITNAQEDDLVDSARSWIACLVFDFTVAAAQGQITNFPNPAVEASQGAIALLDPPPEAGVTGCGDVQPGRLSPGLFHIAVLALAGNGTLVFLIFGLQKQNFVLWYRYISSGFDASSVRPKKRGGKDVTERQYSTYQQLRMGIARATILCCEKFAGIDGDDEVLTPQKPLTYDNHQSNNPKYQANNTSTVGAGEGFVRVSVKKENLDEQILAPRSPRTQIPFPTAPPRSTSLEDFYETPQNRPPPPRWSDLLDPLWGGDDVEF